MNNLTQKLKSQGKVWNTGIPIIDKKLTPLANKKCSQITKRAGNVAHVPGCLPRIKGALSSTFSTTETECG